MLNSPKLLEKKNLSTTLPPNLFYDANIIMIPKAGKDTTKKRKLETNPYNEHRYENSQQILENWIQDHIKMLYHV